jgi:hypothetical protein
MKVCSITIYFYCNHLHLISLICTKCEEMHYGKKNVRIPDDGQSPNTQ